MVEASNILKDLQELSRDLQITETSDESSSQDLIGDLPKKNSSKDFRDVLEFVRDVLSKLKREAEEDDFLCKRDLEAVQEILTSELSGAKVSVATEQSLFKEFSKLLSTLNFLASLANSKDGANSGTQYFKDERLMYAMLWSRLDGVYQKLKWSESLV